MREKSKDLKLIVEDYSHIDYILNELHPTTCL